MRTLLALLAAGCGASQSGGAYDDPVAAQFSEMGKHVIDTLHDGHAGARGVTWDFSADNALPQGWIVQTPPARYWGMPVAQMPVVAECTGDPACDPDFGLIACSAQSDCRFGGTCTPVAATVTRPGGTPRSLCVGHSDAFYDQIYTMVANAQERVEITSLDAPDGRFEVALRNALQCLAHSGRAVRVRYLFGAVYGNSHTAETTLASLTRGLDPASGLRIGVATLRDGPVSWVHTKMIAIDGEIALAGGHNMWTKHYLEEAPVHDLSMQVSGSAALQAAKFSDAMWRHACIPPVELASSVTVVDFPSGTSACAEPFTGAAKPAGTARVITIGRLGPMGDNASDDALIALLDGAKSSIRLSLQDIGPIGVGSEWPDEYLRAVASAIGRGVDIELVMTNVGALPGGLTVGSASYSNGWTPADVIAHVRDYASAHGELSPAVASMCGHLHVTTLRPSTDDKWPNGATFANHAKLVVIDDAMFYIGSQNWYPANLFELGYIVDDEAATKQLLDTYFRPVWDQSKRLETGC